MKTNFSRIDIKSLKKFLIGFCAVLFLSAFLVCFEVYVPFQPMSRSSVTYVVKKGTSESQIAKELQDLKLIRSAFFFKVYTVLSLQREKLQAGRYVFSPGMSTYQIAKKMANGNDKSSQVVIFEGYDSVDIGKILQQEGICNQSEFEKLAKEDYRNDYDFLLDSPKGIGAEGYLFPDTYSISPDQTCEDFLRQMLENFNKKLTPELRAEIKNQKKSVFDIVTMASIIEKEVRSMEDKKLVSGILWKRLSIGMALQVDCTINYITGKNDPGAKLADLQINSPYNTYLYPGLPKGPISNPGIDSITAAIYPQKSPYLFYLSDSKTHYAKTLEEHASNRAKYLE